MKQYHFSTLTESQHKNIIYLMERIERSESYNELYDHTKYVINVLDTLEHASFISPNEKKAYKDYAHSKVDEGKLNIKRILELKAAREEGATV